MLGSVGWATSRLLPAAAASTGLGPFEKLVMAAGAGFHEEVTFRVLLFSGGAPADPARAKLDVLVAFVLAAMRVVGRVRGVHHLGPLGEGITLAAFSFRTFAGLYLCALYASRGFAVAVYTHALYDALVFFVL